MDTIIRSELDSQITQSRYRSKLLNKAAPTPETCLGGKNTPSIG